MIGQLTLRFAEPGDQSFLRSLYIDAHPEFVHLPPDMAAGVIDLQLDAQRGGYLASFPAAVDQVIELADVPVGRCWTHRSGTELRVLDLAVLGSYRRQGIARSVLTGLQTRAAQVGVVLRLSVWRDNVAARNLYDQLGFVVDDDVNGYLRMARA